VTEYPGRFAVTISNHLAWLNGCWHLTPQGVYDFNRQMEDLIEQEFHIKLDTLAGLGLKFETKAIALRFMDRYGFTEMRSSSSPTATARPSSWQKSTKMRLISRIVRRPRHCLWPPSDAHPDPRPAAQPRPTHPRQRGRGPGTVYVDVADVASVPDPNEPLITSDIVLRPGAAWYQLVATRTTLGFTQEGKRDRHGVYFLPKPQGVLAKATPTVAAGLEALDDRRFLLLYRDHKGTTWLVGEPDAPLTFSDKYDAGTATARNNYDFLFSGETICRARPYEGAWLASGVGLSSGVQRGGAGGGLVKIRDALGNLLAIAPGRTVVVRAGFEVAFTIN
jgi:hypothetical protein